MFPALPLTFHLGRGVLLPVAQSPLRARAASGYEALGLAPGTLAPTAGVAADADRDRGVLFRDGGAGALLPAQGRPRMDRRRVSMLLQEPCLLQIAPIRGDCKANCGERVGRRRRDWPDYQP